MGTENCHSSNQQCESPFTSFADLTIPTFDNQFSMDCIKCTIMNMRKWEVSHADVTLSGQDFTNCMGKFCKGLKEMKANLAAKKKNEGGKGKFNNALSADFGKFKTWKHKYHGKKNKDEEEKKDGDREMEKGGDPSKRPHGKGRGRRGRGRQ